eukprot:c21387_g1_i1.p1 GENE.c21387_g1_i1~~c21387_g1_i1.p1  ORF type:complete len:394 (-),score=75.06 c21387_g1_i1:144-1241(-)
MGWVGAGALLLFVLEVVFFTALFLEGNFGKGTLVFTIVFSLGSMLAPFLFLYTLFYFIRGKATKREDIAVYIPIVVLVTSSWFFVMGIFKLFLDKLGKDAFFDVIPEFSSRDHALSWSLAGLYVASAILCLLEFNKHISLISAQARRDNIQEIGKIRRTISIRWLFFIQLILNCAFFIIGMDVLSEENGCAFCVGCVESINHSRQCNTEITQSVCESGGHRWCATREGASFTPVYIASFGVASFALGLVFFLMIMHMFGDSRALASMQNHHTWSLIPIVVLLVNTWVCGSGATRIAMRVLDVQVMRDIFPAFSSSYRAIFIVLVVTYSLQVPVCFFLTRMHLLNLSVGTRKMSVVMNVPYGRLAQ